MGKVQNTKSSGTVVTEFLALNWWLLWVAVATMSLYMYVVLSDISSKYEAVLAKFEEASKGVVMLDYSGRPIYTEKTKLDGLNEGFKKAIANSLRFYAIQDWTTLVGGNFKKPVKTVEDMEKSNPLIAEFKNNFFSAKHPQGLSDFDAFEKTLLFLLNNDNLPEKIIPVDARIETYKVTGDVFELTLDVSVVQNVYLLEVDRWVDKTGNIKIKVVGSFSPINGTPVNPLGIVFDEFKPTYLKKR